MDSAITTVITNGARDIKDMGRTMAELKQRFPGQMDFSKASGSSGSAGLRNGVGQSHHQRKETLTVRSSHGTPDPAVDRDGPARISPMPARPSARPATQERGPPEYGARYRESHRADWWLRQAPGS